MAMKTTCAILFLLSCPAAAHTPRGGNVRAASHRVFRLPEPRGLALQAISLSEPKGESLPRLPTLQAAGSGFEPPAGLSWRQDDDSDSGGVFAFLRRGPKGPRPLSVALSLPKEKTQSRAVGFVLDALFDGVKSPRELEPVLAP